MGRAERFQEPRSESTRPASLPCGKTLDPSVKLKFHATFEAIQAENPRIRLQKDGSRSPLEVTTMLIEFRVENHCSIRDEQVLTMEAGRVGARDDPTPRAVP